MEVILNMFSKYGLIIIFLLIFLEHLNMPGLAAGALLGGAGVVSKKGEILLIEVIIICILASILANAIMYFLGRAFGKKALKFLVKKAPKMEQRIEWAKERSKSLYGGIISRFLPVIRTIAPMIEGASGVSFKRFMLVSLVGITGYNMIFILGGYFLGYIF